MKTYDTGARTHGKSGTLWVAIKRRVRHILDREGELIRLRNAVGLMGEARRQDACEYHSLATSRSRIIEAIKETGEAFPNHAAVLYLKERLKSKVKP